MAIEVVPIPLPASADASKFTQMGREVKGVNPGTASEEQLKEIQDLLYKASLYNYEDLRT
jgi:xanthine dioxygenase